MKCPFCGCDDTQVKDSRNAEDNTAIRRRRECPECGSRFTTFERIQLRDLIVVKKNGEKVMFDRDKLEHSILLAVPADQADKAMELLAGSGETVCRLGIVTEGSDAVVVK